ncbi:DMT family transporter [Cytobacillus sp. S13-E01]|uniref:EamA family transporter n=1 Tax=Cytobacillus sp. S13-E01 TaxID=3031326 RepID=UPI0023D7DACE|nr:DMT family transporter [Cytobacillus sp. S13-E01]MDF0728379.1 DMT family transporter [Cytobacillus sp. S13-E01]
MKNWHYALVVFLGGCCYGVLSTFVKLAYAAGYSMAEVTGSQFLVGTLVIWGVCLFTKKEKIHPMQAFKIILAGIPMGLTGIFYYQSLQTINASLAIIFLFQFVWIGTLVEWIVDKEKPTKGKLVSIVILLFGSILAGGLIGKDELVLSWVGIFWGILAALSFSIFIFVSGTVAKETPPILKSALLSTGGLFVVFVFFPPMFLLDYQVVSGVAPFGLYLGIFGVVLPPLLFSIGMPHIGPGLGTILSASELPVAVIMSALILSEYVGLIQWFGVALILGGIIIGNVKFSKGTSLKSSFKNRNYKTNIN